MQVLAQKNFNSIPCLGLVAEPMTTSQRDAIGSPAAGRLIFLTDTSPNKLQYYNGSVWIDILSSYAALAFKRIVPTSGNNIDADSNEDVLTLTSVDGSISAVGNNTTDTLDFRVNPANLAHQSLSGAGSNTHANIDTHIADSSVHFTQSSIDHGSIAGLSDDDHPQYMKADGTRAFTGAVAGVSPTSGNHLATKAYVDAKSEGRDPKDAVRAATTGNITLSGLLTIDGITLVAGDRVLVKAQSTGSQNGIYVAASGAWTRAEDADSNAEVTQGLWVCVTEGTQNAGTSWLLTTPDPITLGTTALTFVQISGAGTVEGENVDSTGAGVYKQRVGNTLQFRKIKAASTKVSVTENTDTVDVDINESNLTLNNQSGTLNVSKGGTGRTSHTARMPIIGGTSSTGAQQSVAAGSASGQPLLYKGSSTNPAFEALDMANANAVTGTLPITNGGTGATTAAGARTALNVPGKYAANVGNGSALYYAINHALGTRDVVVQVYRNSSPYDVIDCDIEITDTNNVTVRFATAPSTNQFRVVVIG